MQTITKAMVPVCLVLGVAFIFWGTAYPTAREMAVAGAVLLGAVLVRTGACS
jgi:hypothetical protein